MFVMRASRKLAFSELALALLVFTTVVCGAFTPKIALCICVDFRIVHVASFVFVLWIQFTLHADLRMKITQQWGDDRVVSGVPLEEKLYTHQLHLHPTPPAVSPHTVLPVMPAVNGHTQTQTHTSTIIADILHRCKSFRFHPWLANGWLHMVAAK